MTPLMQADDLANSFNASTERKHWRAVVGGSRQLPTVVFNSASSMVKITYYMHSGAFAIAFSKATCAFGDFMASTYKSLFVITTALKASGYPFNMPLGETDGRLRVEYDPKTKQAYASLANTGDDWPAYDAADFKVTSK